MKRKLRKQMRKVKPLTSEETKKLARIIAKHLPHRTYTNEGRFCPT